VEFVSVPAIRAEGRRANEPEQSWSNSAVATIAPKMRVIKGGAGLEIDLSDPRRLADIPTEYRANLPPQGIVNIVEARAIVEMLEGMATDPAFISTNESPGFGPMVAVISVFPVQVVLLQLMLQRSSILANSRLAVEVGTPGAFHQRDAQVVVVSLTRSHATRAVPFSDTPQSLLLALTRPAGRLVLFGDPGTMLRRSQWHGGLDHLDENVGPLEQALLGQLLSQLNRIVNQAPEERASQEVPSRGARSRESTGV
jgi:hypothetical protein